MVAVMIATNKRTNELTDGRNDERKSPCVLQDFALFWAAAQKHVTRGHNIVADGWVGALDPHPHPRPPQMHSRTQTISVNFASSQISCFLPTYLPSYRHALTWSHFASD